MALNNDGWGLMLGWLIWLIVLISVVETFGFLLHCFKRTRSYTVNDVIFQQSRPDQYYKYEAHKNMVSPKFQVIGIPIATFNIFAFQFRKLKYILLVFHLLITTAFTLALIILIGIA